MRIEAFYQLEFIQWAVLATIHTFSKHGFQDVSVILDLVYLLPSDSFK